MKPHYVAIAILLIGSLIQGQPQSQTVPVTYTIDAGGDVHAVVAIPALASAIPVRNEVPVFVPGVVPGGTTAGYWALSHTPLYGVSCYVGGTRQLPVPYTDPFGNVQLGYTLTGNFLSSPHWAVIGTGGNLWCDYEYAPGT